MAPIPAHPFDYERPQPRRRSRDQPPTTTPGDNDKLASAMMSLFGAVIADERDSRKSAQLPQLEALSGQLDVIQSSLEDIRTEITIARTMALMAIQF